MRGRPLWPPAVPQLEARPSQSNPRGSGTEVLMRERGHVTAANGVAEVAVFGALQRNDGSGWLNLFQNRIALEFRYPGIKHDLDMPHVPYRWCVFDMLSLEGLNKELCENSPISFGTFSPCWDFAWGAYWGIRSLGSRSCQAWEP